MIHRKKYGWGTLYLKVDLRQGSSPIRYSYDGSDWRSTPFQTADAKHKKANAFSLVNRWLSGQNPATKKKKKKAKTKRPAKKNAAPYSSGYNVYPGNRRAKTLAAAIRIAKKLAATKYSVPVNVYNTNGKVVFSATGSSQNRNRKGPKKKRSTARKKPNPGKQLRAKISQMKPGSWYPTTLSGAKVKVQRKGNSLVIRPAGKKRSR